MEQCGAMIRSNSKEHAKETFATSSYMYVMNSSIVSIIYYTSVPRGS